MAGAALSKGAERTAAAARCRDALTPACRGMERLSKNASAEGMDLLMVMGGSGSFSNDSSSLGGKGGHKAVEDVWKEGGQKWGARGCITRRWGGQVAECSVAPQHGQGQQPNWCPSSDVHVTTEIPAHGAASHWVSTETELMVTIMKRLALGSG